MKDGGSTKLAFMAALACLAGCGSKTDANARNFGAAIERHLEEGGRSLCLGTDRWPVDVPANDVGSTNGRSGDSPSARMQALQKAGLVSASEIDVDEGAWFGKTTGRMRKVVRYTLTEAAKPYTREPERVHVAWGSESATKVLDLCWGRKSLDKVVKWEGPMEFGAFKTARVIYTYKIVDMADWAKGAEMQEAFRTIGIRLKQAEKEDVEPVKLTSEGWEVKKDRSRR
jgi:hypothetical protein